ncbi:MAG: FtsX-like permease family protein [Coriobacteriales bacterium]|nr:FtsX-like permease family protein [Coriobacteriales bacterium]
MRRAPLLSSSFYKVLLRSIRGSLGRFLAIVGIVALGCGFYAGLQMCGPDMRAAADALYDGCKLYDIRLVSTLGFGEDDVSRVENVPGVDGAMAAISCDVMARLGSEQLAVRMASLDVDDADAGEEQGANTILSSDGSYLNRVFLREGRWPRGANECVISADKSVAGVGVGDTMELLYGTRDLDETLRERSFKIVGMVSSPAYPYTGSFGSTTLGSGMISEYVYVAPDAFVEDAPFTEIYVRVLDSDKYESGSEAYQEHVNVVCQRLEGRSSRLASARLEDLRSAGGKQIEEAQKELDAGEADAKAQLDAGRAKLDAAKKELDDGQTAYDEGVAELERGRAQAAEQFASAQRTLDESAAQLEAGKAELAAGKQALFDQLAERGMVATSLDSARSQLEILSASLNAAQSLMSELGGAQDMVSELEVSVARYEALLQSLSNFAGSSAEQQSWLDSLRERLFSARELAAELEALAEREDASEITKLMARSAAERVLDLEAQIAQAEQSIADSAVYQQLLSAARQDLDEAKANLERLRERAASLPSEADLQAQQAQIREAFDGITQMEEAQAAIALGETQLAQGKAQLETQKATTNAELAKGQTELDAGKKKLDEGRRAYEEGRAEFERQEAEATRRLAEAKRQVAEGRQKLDELEAPEIYVLDRSKSEGLMTYDGDSQRMDSIADVFPAIFFLVAALVALTTMTRMVDDERVEIGTYKALGYSKAKIASKYLCYAGAASLLGAVVGILALSQLLPFVVTSSYSIIYSIPLHPFPLPVSLPIALVSGGLGVGITLLATVATVIASLRESPATLMLPRAPVAGKRILLERFGPLWRHMSFSWKVTCRNLFRYKRRLAMTVVGISGCTALLLVGFGLHDAIWDIIDCQYGPIIHYDTTVALKDDASELDVAEVVDYLDGTQGFSDIARVEQENMHLGVRDREDTQRVEVIVPEDEGRLQQMVTFRDRLSKEPVAFDSKSVVVSEKLALKFGLKAGDELLLYGQDALGNVTGEGHALTVTGVAENYVGTPIYVGRDAWRSVDEKTQTFATILGSSTKDESFRKKLSEELREHEDVSTVSFSDESINQYRNMLSVVDLVVMLLIVSAGALAFIVLYNLTNINVAERVREIASLKVLGFTRGEVYAYIFREITLLALMGDCLGIVFGTWLSTFVVTTAEVDYVMFGRSIHPMSYVYAFALTMLFAVLIMLVMRRKLDKVDMVESLKSVE